MSRLDQPVRFACTTYPNAQFAAIQVRYLRTNVSNSCPPADVRPHTSNTVKYFRTYLTSCATCNPIRHRYHIYTDRKMCNSGSVLGETSSCKMHSYCQFRFEWMKTIFCICNNKQSIELFKKKRIFFFNCS